MKVYNILFGLLILVFILIAILSFTVKIVDKEVDCYDKYGHKIIDQKCISQKFSGTGSGLLKYLPLVFVIVIPLILLSYILDLQL